MEILWKITREDTKKVLEFYNKHKTNPFVRRRYQRNVTNKPSRISKPSFWRGAISCLLTTQQPSGPDSAVNRFNNTRPYPLSLKKCRESKNVAKMAKKALKEFGGIRHYNRISDFIEKNLRKIEGDVWLETRNVLQPLLTNGSIVTERKAATFIDENYIGFGPKQSRNLLQILGLSKYEIPIDSRITKWLNNFGFPVHLSSGALSNHHYYNFVLDGIQFMCEKADLYPCMLDAAIFSSFDEDRW